MPDELVSRVYHLRAQGYSGMSIQYEKAKGTERTHLLRDYLLRRNERLGNS